MDRVFLLIADKFFFLFHALFTLFCTLGWIWSKTRKANLILILATAFSWFGLGIFFGIGYCPFTDWHWQVRYALGYRGLPRSYVKYFLDVVTGLNWDAALVDWAVAVLFGGALILSVIFNIRDYLKRKGFTQGG